MSKNKEFYRKALGVLNERGLHKGSLVNPKSGKEVCAFGACAVADGKEIVAETIYDVWIGRARTHFHIDEQESDLFEAYTELTTAAQELFPDRYNPDHSDEDSFNIVPEVNDDPETTFEDVQSIIKRAEELAED